MHWWTDEVTILKVNFILNIGIKNEFLKLFQILHVDIYCKIFACFYTAVFVPIKWTTKNNESVFDWKDS